MFAACACGLEGERESYNIKGQQESARSELCAQVDIMNMLQLEQRQISVVGDDHQAIYGFRGSYPDIFNEFISNYDHEALQQSLTKNYRSATCHS